eukprot:741193-Rhodomonas_salina.1
MAPLPARNETAVFEAQSPDRKADQDCAPDHAFELAQKPRLLLALCHKDQKRIPPQIPEALQAVLLPRPLKHPINSTPRELTSLSCLEPQRQHAAGEVGFPAPHHLLHLLPRHNVDGEHPRRI